MSSNMFVIPDLRLPTERQTLKTSDIHGVSVVIHRQNDLQGLFLN